MTATCQRPSVAQQAARDTASRPRTSTQPETKHDRPSQPPKPTPTPPAPSQPTQPAPIPAPVNQPAPPSAPVLVPTESRQYYSRINPPAPNPAIPVPPPSTDRPNPPLPQPPADDPMEVESPCDPPPASSAADNEDWCDATRIPPPPPPASQPWRPQSPSVHQTVGTPCAFSRPRKGMSGQHELGGLSRSEPSLNSPTGCEQSERV